jgi:hypothetical protein
MRGLQRCVQLDRQSLLEVVRSTASCTGEACASVRRRRWPRHELDLAHDVVLQDSNKTEHARFWKLSRDVAAAMLALQRLKE